MVFDYLFIFDSYIIDAAPSLNPYSVSVTYFVFIVPLSISKLVLNANFLPPQEYGYILSKLKENGYWLIATDMNGDDYRK